MERPECEAYEFSCHFTHLTEIPMCWQDSAPTCKLDFGVFCLLQYLLSFLDFTDT